jgi:hypothetical protein
MNLAQGSWFEIDKLPPQRKFPLVIIILVGIICKKVP